MPRAGDEQLWRNNGLWTSDSVQVACRLWSVHCWLWAVIRSDSTELRTWARSAEVRWLDSEGLKNFLCSWKHPWCTKLARNCTPESLSPPQLLHLKSGGVGLTAAAKDENKLVLFKNNNVHNHWASTLAVSNSCTLLPDPTVPLRCFFFPLACLLIYLFG